MERWSSPQDLMERVSSRSGVRRCSFGDCPDENQFVVLTQGLLEPDEVEHLEGVIDRCASCAELMIELARALGPEEDVSAPSPSTSPTTSGPTRIGRYQVRRLLGAGGMGVVYEAYDQELERKVALKLLRPDVTDPAQREFHRARMLREAKMLASLTHPNVLAIYEVGTWEDQVFLAMQYVDGADMRQWLDEHDPTWEELLGMYLRIGEGLVAAHARRIIHRDIKPDNLLVSQQGKVFLTDFGLARVMQSTAHSVSIASVMHPLRDPQQLTMAGDILGTPAYMSPEQFRGRGVSKRSDQFSFCVALYEGLYGMLPFGGHSLRELMESAQSGEIHRPDRSRVPKEIFEVLAKGMHPVPRERFGSMRELLQALQKARQRARIRKAALPVSVAACLIVLLGWGASLLLPGLFGQGQPPTQRRVSGLTRGVFSKAPTTREPLLGPAPTDWSALLRDRISWPLSRALLSTLPPEKSDSRSWYAPLSALNQDSTGPPRQSKSKASKSRASSKRRGFRLSDLIPSFLRRRVRSPIKKKIPTRKRSPIKKRPQRKTPRNSVGLKFVPKKRFRKRPQKRSVRGRRRRRKRSSKRNLQRRRKARKSRARRARALKKRRKRRRTNRKRRGAYRKKRGAYRKKRPRRKPPLSRKSAKVLRYQGNSRKKGKRGLRRTFRVRYDRSSLRKQLQGTGSSSDSGKNSPSMAPSQSSKPSPRRKK